MTYVIEKLLGVSFGYWMSIIILEYLGIEFQEWFATAIWIILLWIVIIADIMDW